MTPLTTVKACLLLVGAAIFAYGARTDLTGIRWAGIALMAGAFLLRFVGASRPR